MLWVCGDSMAAYGFWLWTIPVTHADKAILDMVETRLESFNAQFVTDIDLVYRGVVPLYPSKTYLKLKSHEIVFS